MKLGVKCRLCGREFEKGEVVKMADWKVIETKGDETVVRMETRYECDPRCP